MEEASNPSPDTINHQKKTSDKVDIEDQVSFEDSNMKNKILIIQKKNRNI